MIFADKLIHLRKKAGWSQEELAEQMNVTRQSVSKWEGAQSVPDIEKMVRLSELFGVSTDYLLKDEIENVECLNPSEDISSLKRVSMEEANAFLSVKAITSKSIAYATLLCILSPIYLLVLGVISETPKYALSDSVAGGIGMIVLLTLVAIAVAIFISSGSKTASFEYSKEKKEKSSVTTTIVVSYWLIATTIYLAYSLATNDWGYSWIVWVVAGVLFPAVIAITNAFAKRK